MEFTRLLSEFPGISSPTTRRESITKHNTVHVIETKGALVNAKARRLNAQKLKIVKEAFKIMLAEGECRPSKSLWASPLHMAPKQGKDCWQMCGDYRALNSKTLPDCYPVPNILDFNATLKGACKFTKIDVF